MLKYKGLVEEKEKRINELVAQFVALKIQNVVRTQTARAQSVPPSIVALEVTEQKPMQTEVEQRVQETVAQPPEKEVVELYAME